MSRALTSSRGRRRHFSTWIPPLLVGVLSVFLIGGAERLLRYLSPEVLADGYRVQDWSSNWMMQALGIEDIIARGPSALWLDHIYPPLLDLIRLAIAWPQRGLDVSLLQPFVDMKLYDLYAVLFGLVNVMLFLWVRLLTQSQWWATGAVVIWAIMPGYVMTMTLLDPSPLSMTFITATFFFLFLFLRTRRFGYSTLVFASLLLASLSRSVTQPHVLAVVVISAVAFWVMAKHRNWLLMLVNLALVALMFVMPIKQHALFATFDTTSFGGYHRAGMLWIAPSTVLTDHTPQYAIDNALIFTSRYNTQTNVRDNFRLNEAANTFIKEQPVQAAINLGRSLGVTVPELLRPASSYTQNYLVEKMPWRAAFDWLFSGWRYIALVGLAVILIVRHRGRLSSARLVRRYGWFFVFYGLIALPILFSNRFRPEDESVGPIWTDASRQKVFLEAPVMVMLAYAAWVTFSSLRKTRSQKAKAEIAESLADRL
jgi:hypothetical protein